jgi:DNA-binding NtrC family response regulator
MPKLPLVVCIDDDEAILTTVVRCLRREALELRSSSDPVQVLKWIAEEDVSVLVSDYDMPEMNGAQLAGEARRLRPETVRILLTGHRTLETAIDGINQGEIFRFIGKPFENDQLRAAVLEGAKRHDELVALSGDRQRRDRRVAMHAALEAEYPRISLVTHGEDGSYEVAADPWPDAAALGLAGLTSALERK